MIRNRYISYIKRMKNNKKSNKKSDAMFLYLLPIVIFIFIYIKEYAFFMTLKLNPLLIKVDFKTSIEILPYIISIIIKQ